MRGRGVTLEMCPVSSIISYDLPRDGRHPLRRLFDAGVLVTVNTDNLTVLGTDLDREYDSCREMGFTDEEILKMCFNAARASFLPPEKKQALLQRMQAFCEG